MTASEIKYLTAIYELSSEDARVKQSELAKKLRLSRVSVLRAIEKLHNKKFVTKDDKAQCSLTEKGKECVLKYKKCCLYLEKLFIESLCSRPQNAKIEAIAILGAMSVGNVENLYRKIIKEEEESQCR